MYKPVNVPLHYLGRGSQLIMVLRFGYYSALTVISVSSMESFGALKSCAPESMPPLYSKTDQKKLP